VPEGIGCLLIPAKLRRDSSWPRSTRAWSNRSYIEDLPLLGQLLELFAHLFSDRSHRNALLLE